MLAQSGYTRFLRNPLSSHFSTLCRHNSASNRPGFVDRIGVI
ncbi:hypothetical protein EG68_12475 [Paragonimus skrjabini miyazakii]|uniref:Uncharacterized protein n=1 Tax=Paragonimus skrjabini miyazakii TaxID=59628 RepID=A0A8S9YHG8_9TREM|nr:hypothetical protein EG68_12475 [Paragonimus skrjabini miyazakii]